LQTQLTIEEDHATFPACEFARKETPGGDRKVAAACN
jgi:hypothetical protein